MAETTWRDRVQQCVTLIRQMEPRFEGEPDPIEPGSSLAGDDAGRPKLPVSNLVWFGLSAAQDHLSQLADILTAEGLGQRPFAPHTLARSALLCASQAVWLLGAGSREIRLNRAALIYLDEWTNQRTYLKDYRNDPLIAHDIDAKGMAQIDTLLARLDTKIANLKPTVSGRYTSTGMLQEAAEWATRQESSSWRRRAYLHQWRVGSAVAHGRMWSLNLMAGKSDTSVGDSVLRTFHLTDEELGTALGSAWMMTNAGIGLWDERRTNHLTV